jgi:endonuclease-3
VQATRKAPDPARRGPGRTAKHRAGEVLDRLDAEWPDAGTELDHRDPWELLVAVILSAQCTDRRVNLVTPALFAEMPTAAAMALRTAEDIEPFIATCGLFRSKAKNLAACARIVSERHRGEVPATLAELEALPGVGRKTANVMLSNAFGEAAIAVDTHVHRLSRRLGWSKATDPLGVERDLQALLPRDRWSRAHHTLIWHGRRCCHARRPACGRCPVAELCPSRESPSAGGP